LVGQRRAVATLLSLRELQTKTAHVEADKARRQRCGTGMPGDPP
jgi:hypothetical protein